MLVIHGFSYGQAHCFKISVHGEHCRFLYKLILLRCPQTAGLEGPNKTTPGTPKAAAAWANTDSTPTNPRQYLIIAKASRNETFPRKSTAPGINGSLARPNCMNVTFGVLSTNSIQLDIGQLLLAVQFGVMCIATAFWYRLKIVFACSSSSSVKKICTFFSPNEAPSISAIISTACPIGWSDGLNVP